MKTLSAFAGIYSGMFNAAVAVLGISPVSVTSSQCLVCTAILATAFLAGIVTALREGFSAAHISDAVVLLVGLAYFVRNCLSRKTWTFFVSTLLITVCTMWPFALAAIVYVLLGGKQGGALVTLWHVASLTFLCVALWANLSRSSSS